MTSELKFEIIILITNREKSYKIIGKLLEKKILQRWRVYTREEKQKTLVLLSQKGESSLFESTWLK